MNEQSSTAEIAALRELYAAINRNDIIAVVRAFHPDIVWVEPAEPPASGTHRGLMAIKQHFATSRAAWAEGSCEPEQFFVADDKVIVFVHVRVKLKTEQEWREGRFADVFTFRDGKVVHARVVVDRQQALAEAGVKEPLGG